MPSKNCYQGKPLENLQFLIDTIFKEIDQISLYPGLRIFDIWIVTKLTKIMARTLLSVLTEEIRLESLLTSTINHINYSTGYVGSNEKTFIAFLKNNNLANHILFVKPTIESTPKSILLI